METIKTLYKIGHGPSSSHTMGPANAAKYFKNHFPYADAFEITLYGSLALTGRGHLTDQAIIQTLQPVKTTINWNATDSSIEHPNTMDFIAYQDGKEIGKTRIYSIGGGSIRIKGETNQDITPEDLYKEKNTIEILDTCRKLKISLLDYVKQNENSTFWEHLQKVWDVMQQAVQDGLKQTDPLPGKLKLKRKAKILFESSIKKLKSRHVDNFRNRLMAYAFACSETNASGGIVVTSPTCGACGILPAVLLHAKEQLHIEDKKILDGLAIAGLIGNIARTNGSIAGAEAGCQAEVGIACAMAAAAYAHFIKLSNKQIFAAAVSALEHHLGLTCDPVLGYVQSPCIERNALAALRAIDAADLISLTSEGRIFNFDDIIATMLETGKALNAGYRETSTAGLADIYNKKISSKFKRKFDIKVS